MRITFPRLDVSHNSTCNISPPWHTKHKDNEKISRYVSFSRYLAICQKQNIYALSLHTKSEHSNYNKAKNNLRNIPEHVLKPQKSQTPESVHYQSLLSNKSLFLCGFLYLSCTLVHGVCLLAARLLSFLSCLVEYLLMEQHEIQLRNLLSGLTGCFLQSNLIHFF